MPSMHFLLALTVAAFLLAVTALSPALSQAIAQPIYRCGNNYSQEACKGGKAVEDKTTALHSGYPGSTVYLSESHGGDFFLRVTSNAVNTTLSWSALKPNLPHGGKKVAQDGVQWYKTQRNTEFPSTVYSNRSPPSAEPGKKACQALDERAKALNGVGRAGTPVLRPSLGMKGT